MQKSDYCLICSSSISKRAFVTNNSKFIGNAVCGRSISRKLIGIIRVIYVAAKSHVLHRDKISEPISTRLHSLADIIPFFIYDQVALDLETETTLVNINTYKFKDLRLMGLRIFAICIIFRNI